MHYTFLLHSKIKEEIAKNHERERERGGDKHTHCVPPISHLISLRDKEEFLPLSSEGLKRPSPRYKSRVNI